jgi:hypothetical protein
MRHDNEHCRDFLEISADGKVLFSIQTRIDKDALFDSKGRCIEIGHVVRRKNAVSAEFIEIDYRSLPTPPVSITHKHCDSEESALGWLSSQLDFKMLPGRFERAIRNTTAWDA